MRLLLLGLITLTGLSMGATGRIECTGPIPPFFIFVQPEGDEDDDDLDEELEEEIEEIF